MVTRLLFDLKHTSNCSERRTEKTPTRPANLHTQLEQADAASFKLQEHRTWIDTAQGHDAAALSTSRG